MMKTHHIAIIGAGFSGTMLSRHLVENATYPLIISLFDASGSFAEGIAYSTRSPHHMLNVRAEKMSALPDQPDHFVQWLQKNTWRKLHPAFERLALDGKSFAPRMIYGAYLRDQLAITQRMAKEKGHVIDCIPKKVTDIHMEDSECIVTYGQTTMTVDAAILAVGNLPPKDFLYGRKLFQVPHRFTHQVWNIRQEALLHPGVSTTSEMEPVAILGSGLTMVDMIFSLREKEVKVPIIGFSRHGYLPAMHESYVPYPHQWQPENLPHTALGLFIWLRKEIHHAAKEGFHWQAVIDSLRPITNALWKLLPIREKRRFMRHLFSVWNIHRHRMPAESQQLLTEMQASGQLKLIKGSIIDVDHDEESLIISYHQRGKPGLQTMRLSYLLNCTGSEQDIGKIPHNNLLYKMRENGYLTVGTMRSGVEQHGWHLQGKAANYLFVMGSLCFGSLMETTAVPDLRVQAKELALYLLTFLKERPTTQFEI